jgi:hypothetical protein
MCGEESRADRANQIPLPENAWPPGISSNASSFRRLLNRSRRARFGMTHKFSFRSFDRSASCSPVFVRAKRPIRLR